LARDWVFCSRATRRNVTMVVAVLMTNCQVSTLPNAKYVGAQTRMSNTHNAKNHARDTNEAAVLAKRSNSDRSGVTSLGMVARRGRWSVSNMAVQLPDTPWQQTLIRA